MVARSKPLIVAVALALGASTAAFAQTETRVYGNTDSIASPATMTHRSMEEEHGGMRNRMMRGDSGLRGYADNTNSLIAPASPTDTSAYADAHGRVVGNGAMSDDARERAARAARVTPDEEHGGLRNWLKDKKASVRAKLGMQPDQD
ncbi:MAG: hypothetical protein ABI920_11745 [Casimicrobiaceae bacterium]